MSYTPRARMGNKADSPGVRDRYARLLAGYLQQCAEDLERRPDACLWNCRRCLESILCLCQTQANPDFQPGADPGALENFARTLPGTYRGAWTTVLVAGNFGVHVHSQEQEQKEDDFSSRALKAAGELVYIAEWFFYKSEKWEGDPPAGVRENLERLKAGKAIPVRDYERELEGLKARLELASAHADRHGAEAAEVAGRLKREQEERLLVAGQLDASRRDAEVAASDASRRVHALEIQLRERDLEVEALRAAPHTLAGAPMTPPAPAPSSRPQISETATPARRVVWVLVPLALCFLGGVGVLAMRSASAPVPNSPTPEAIRPLGGGLSVAAPDQQATSSPPASPSPPPSQAASRACPPGTIRVAGGNATPKQPKRPGWPAPLGATVAAAVGTFCMDKELVSLGDYLACVGQLRCPSLPKSPNDACAWTGRRDHPALCLAHEEAATFCREMRQARLPSVHEWELVAASGIVSQLRTHNRTGEWASEPFPAPAFNRGSAEKSCKSKGEQCFMIFAPLVGVGEPSALDPGWNRDLGVERRADVGFRCVAGTDAIFPTSTP